MIKAINYVINNSFAGRFLLIGKDWIIKMSRFNNG